MAKRSWCEKCKKDHQGTFVYKCSCGEILNSADNVLQMAFKYGCPLHRDCRAPLEPIGTDRWKCSFHGDVYIMARGGDKPNRLILESGSPDPKLHFWSSDPMGCPKCKTYGGMYWEIRDVQNCAHCRACGYEMNGPFA